MSLASHVELQRMAHVCSLHRSNASQGMHSLAVGRMGNHRDPLQLGRKHQQQECAMDCWSWTGRYGANLPAAICLNFMPAAPVMGTGTVDMLMAVVGLPSCA